MSKTLKSTAPYSEAPELESFDFDYDDLPEEITTVFGQRMELRDSDGNWITHLRPISPGYRSSIVELPKRINSHPVIEYAARLWIIQRLQGFIEHRSDLRILFSLQSLNVPLDASSIKATELIGKWISKELSRYKAASKADSLMSVKLFVLNSVEESIWGFDESLLSITRDYPFSATNLGTRVTLLDTDDGPYTTVEMQEINECIKETSITLSEKVVIKLCQAFGLRPIQLALLREEDVWRDEGGPAIRIPSVKGIQRSKLRRTRGNFTERELTEDLYDDIRALMIENNSVFERLQRVCDEWGKENDVPVSRMPRPLFPAASTSPRTIERIKRYLSVPSLRQYAFHNESWWLSHVLAKLTTKLRIPTKDRSGRPSILKIGAYRFRYTIGTSLVLHGRSPEEVALALDHVSMQSVEHYFRFNRDVFNYVSEAHLRSSEIIDAARRWAGKMIDSASTAYGARIISVAGEEVHRISEIGLCSKKTWCEYQPVVSCYSCNVFRPFSDGDHRLAREIIESTRQQWVGQSSGTMRAVLDNALRGVNEIIALQSEDKEGVLEK